MEAGPHFYIFYSELSILLYIVTDVVLVAALKKKKKVELFVQLNLLLMPSLGFFIILIDDRAVLKVVFANKSLRQFKILTLFYDIFKGVKLLAELTNQRRSFTWTLVSFSTL